ncbi:hypothetical protein NDU88_000166, partial [Pleurodeles waltl]
IFPSKSQNWTPLGRSLRWSRQDWMSLTLVFCLVQQHLYSERYVGQQRERK